MSRRGTQSRTPASESVTIASVAAAAGVSTATVSRVLSGNGRVSRELSDAVLAAASALGYTPNPAAQGLASGSSRSIGVVVPNLANPYFYGVIQGIGISAQNQGYRMLVVDSREDAALEATLVRDFLRHTDAIVLVSPRQSHAELVALDRQGVRAVLVNRAEVGIGLPSIFLDNTSTMLSICGHLANLGHRRVAYLAGPEAAWHETVRRQAMMQAEAFGIDVVVVPAGGTIEAGFRAVPAALETDTTALVCFNDLVAFGAVAALAERGISVPDDISVTGFDDIEFSAYARPSLTTARAPKQQLGEQAWLLAQALIRGEQPDQVAPLRTELVIRDSTGPARQR